MSAAVLWEPRRPVEVVDVTLAPPRADEVLVRIAASGVCASDLHVVDGQLPEPLPLVLGHEAAGVVEDVGGDVRRIRVGDHVMLSILPSCGRCRICRRGRPNFCEVQARVAATGRMADGTSRLSVDGTVLHHFNAVSSFAEYAVVPASGTIPVSPELSLDVVALMSCAVLTGFGAVANTARVPEGASVAVWGCGGVGLNAVQAARIAGAGPIIGVDVRAEKLELAMALGATHAVDAGREDPVAAVRALTDGGVEYAFEAHGRERTIRAAWEATQSCGTVVVVGMPPRGSALTIDPAGFISEKALVGSYLGSASIERDVPRLLDLYRRGELRLDDVITRRIPLTELNDAFARLRAGKGVRTVVVFDT